MSSNSINLNTGTGGRPGTAAVENESGMEKAALKAGSNLASAEKMAFEAFSVDAADSAAIKALAKKLGAPNSEKMDLEGLRLFAKRLLDKAQSAYEMLTNLFNVKKRTQDTVINNVGR